MEKLNILSKHEKFKRHGDKIDFHCVVFIVEQAGIYYTGSLSDRYITPNDVAQLDDLQKIETKDRGPKLQDQWTIAQPSDCHYVKKPKLEDYLDPELEARIALEIEVWELIRQRPHEGLAVYHGCVVADGRVSGLCFERYEQTLMQRVNPKALSKPDFARSDRSLVQNDIKQCLQTIREALEHLHSIGFSHNDLNPSNIMMDKDNRAVIIDMDSSCRVGESLEKKKRTYGWLDKCVNYSTFDNDLKALDEVETWLFGTADHLKLN
ncbi:serine threonine protein kinase [Fusarium langsethiae]|uniref:Serine threonine protein kinase n=1 Tax=Fusarium langsethiae TaxID=179993 RepID=A0A0M9EPS3_FUSLA|nr:serine threonine protein kinase [Fusarium langsethiae]GKU08606.1 unnamed protein product [Fusarium langsethiae]